MSQVPDKTTWRTPEVCLILMAAAAPFSFSIWMSLLNNFTVEVAGFTGKEIGILQSLREIPGFLAFTAVFLLLILREQVFAVLALAVLGLGVAITGFFPSTYGLYFTTVIMSVGFHYFETIQMSLSLQWLPKAVAPRALGRQMSARSVGSLLAYGVIFATIFVMAPDMIDEMNQPKLQGHGQELMETASTAAATPEAEQPAAAPVMKEDRKDFYLALYLIGGGITAALALFIWLAFPRIDGHEIQHKHMVIRKSDQI